MSLSDEIVRQRPQLQISPVLDAAAAQVLANARKGGIPDPGPAGAGVVQAVRAGLPGADLVSRVVLEFADDPAAVAGRIVAGPRMSRVVLDPQWTHVGSGRLP